MDIDTIVAAVISETGRPEKSVIIERAVRSSILKAHEINFFPQDRIDGGSIVASSPATLISETLPTRWRKFNLVRPMSTGDVPLGLQFKNKSPDNVFDFDGNVLGNYYYVQGSNVIMEGVNQIDKFQWVYYEYPDTVAGTIETWLMARYPQELIDLASAYVYQKLSDSVSARLYRELWTGVRTDPEDTGHRGRIERENLLESL